MYCPNCGQPITEGHVFCSNCGQSSTLSESPSAYQEAVPAYSSPQVTSSIIPPEIRKWNWGAFTLNMIWGIGNHAYLTLLCLVPLLNIVWVFVCGAKGNEWAYKSGKFKSVEEFLAVQRTWNRAGLAVFVFYIVYFLIFFIIMFFAMLAASSSLSMY